MILFGAHHLWYLMPYAQIVNMILLVNISEFWIEILFSLWHLVLHIGILEMMFLLKFINWLIIL